MKNSLITLLFFYSTTLLAVDVPNDSLIQSVLKAHYKRNVNISCMNPYEDGALQSDFSITFKDTLTLKRVKYLLVVNRIPNGAMHGHTLGCVNYFLLQKMSNGWNVVFEVLNNEPEPVMDFEGFEIVNIGIGNKGLLSTSSSTGNHHYEKDLAIINIELGKLEYLLNVDLVYDNSAWNLPKSFDLDCEAYRTTRNIEFIPSDKLWFDLEVHVKEYKFSNGCENQLLISESTERYVFENGRYLKR